MRWSEEILLLQEEMRRVLAFLSWKSNEWWGRKGLLTGLSAGDAEGLAAYAYRQAALYHGLSEKFAKKWQGVSKMVAESQRHPDVK